MPWALCIALVLGCLIGSGRAAETSNVPETLKVFVGGFRAVCYRVEWRDGALVYTSLPDTGDEVSVTIHPTEEQWADFWRRLDDMGFWQWHGNFKNERIDDGAGWAVEIVHDGHSLKLEASNSYPTAKGEPNDRPERTETFEYYLHAVEKLLGGKAFR